MVFEKPIDLAIHEEVGAPEIQELLPLGVAVADHPGVRPTVEGVCRINHGGPALVPLGEQQHVAIAADPGVGALARTGSAPSVICPWRAKTPASFNVSADESGAPSASGCSGPPSPRGTAFDPSNHPEALPFAHGFETIRPSEQARPATPRASLPMPIVQADRLTRIGSALLKAAGASGEEADAVAVGCVNANLAGHDSHGVIAIPTYIDRITAGHIMP